MEDSEVAYALLERIISQEPELRVIGWAKNGHEALTLAAELRPDVITMDIAMEGLDGYETTRQIMERQPTPIIIVSVTYDPHDVMQAFRALEAGAVGMTGKPPGLHSPGHAVAARRLVEMIKAMAEVKLEKRTSTQGVRQMHHGRVDPLNAGRGDGSTKRPVGVVAIGASTGGPPVLAEILQELPKPFPVPILVVQQIAPGFVEGLAEWLGERGGMPVRVARHGERALPGTVYLAPDGINMRVTAGALLECLEERSRPGGQPEVGTLFHSVADSFGACAVGIILTGAGSDGVEELKLMRFRGAVTFAQDRQSCIVYGMPCAAAKAGAATYVLSPLRIAASLADLVRSGPGSVHVN